MARFLVVTAKQSPDLDGVACTVAQAELLAAVGTPAVAVVAGQPDAEARYVLDHLGVVPPSRPPENVNGVVLVDMSALPGLPDFADPAAVIEVIDHRLHGDPSRSFPNAKVQVEKVGAAATLVFERFQHQGISPSPNSALLLQAAIHSNTQRLRGAVTTPRDVAAASALAESHPLPTGFIEAQFRARAAEILEDLPAAIRRETKTFDHPDGTFWVAQLECPGALDLVDEARRVPAPLRNIVNLVDPLRAASMMVVQDESFRVWVATQVGIEFDGDVARPSQALLRKQIVARLLDAGERP